MKAECVDARNTALTKESHDVMRLACIRIRTVWRMYTHNDCTHKMVAGLRG